MSAIAFAVALTSDQNHPPPVLPLALEQIGDIGAQVRHRNTLLVVTLLRVMAEYRAMTDRDRESYRLVIRDHYDALADELAEAVRSLPPEERSPKALLAAMDDAKFPTEMEAATPGEVFLSGMHASLTQSGPEAEDEVRRIILRAATHPVDGTAPLRAGQWAAKQTGRPAASPELIRRAKELREQGLILKEVAKILSEEFGRKISADAVRDLFKPRRTRK